MDSQDTLLDRLATHNQQTLMRRENNRLGLISYPLADAFDRQDHAAQWRIEVIKMVRRALVK